MTWAAASAAARGARDASVLARALLRGARAVTEVALVAGAERAESGGEERAEAGQWQRATRSRTEGLSRHRVRVQGGGSVREHVA